MANDAEAIGDENDKSNEEDSIEDEQVLTEMKRQHPEKVGST